MNRFLVVQTEELDPGPAAWLAQQCELVACRVDDPRFPQLAPRVEALVIRTYTRIDAALLARLPRLRVIGRAGVGLDNIDVDACTARGVRVVHTPDANSDAVSELVFAFLLDVTRPRLFLDAPLPPERWRTLRHELRAPRQLKELTLGIVGLGRVGRRVARIGAAFGMRCIYHDLLDIPAAERSNAEPVSFDEVLRHADVISLHVDPRPANRHLLGQAALARVRPAAILLNTSRGLVVDHAALAQFLRANPASSAVLDVHEPEPITDENPLLGLPNAHLSPHIGAATRLAQENMSWVVRDVWAALSTPSA